LSGGVRGRVGVCRRAGISVFTLTLCIGIANMNWDQIKGNWKQFKGKVKEKWGKLTDDDLDVIAGKKDQLAGKLQQRYGYAKEQAEKELDEFCGHL
jgi:uncharacterized protein YjbJ (UPF0337 family)